MKRITVCLAIAMIVVSCSGRFFESRGEVVDTEGTLSHDMIVLGKQLDDPYSVENMTKALAAVCPTKAGTIRLEVTDYYVRFRLRDDRDFAVLESSGIQLLDHPMDYEILKEGDYYQDPGIPEGEITWQYAVVDKDFVFPDGVGYEVLDECYIAEHNPTKAADVDWDAVEREAYRLSGNESMLDAATKADAGAPSGRIAVMDPLYSSEPVGVAGVKVTCNAFVKTAVTYTDADGYYSMDRTFNSKLRYRIVFKNRKGFGIGLNMLLVPASVSTLGKHGPEGVSVVIDNTMDHRLFCRAAVNNAAYDYYESCTSGSEKLKAPPSNLRIWLFGLSRASSAVMMQQGAVIDNSLVADFLGDYSPLVKMFLPDITIGIMEREDFASLYSTTIHELSHASHFMQAGVEYWNRYIEYILLSFVTSGFITYGTGTEKDSGYCDVGESWAYYMESLYYRQRYSDLSKMFGTSYWFSPQILMYMDERGLGHFKIFRALTSDITNRQILQKKLISMYPESKSLINRAFSRY